MGSISEFFKKLFKSGAKEIQKAANTKTITLSSITVDPDEVTELPEFDRKDPKMVAALTVVALCRYPKSKEECFAMLDNLKGPEPLTNRDKEFIRDRFMDGKDYVPKSYFAGATPENNYTPSKPLQVKIVEQSNSFENDGYARFWIPSGGADSPRQITLRQKKSTGEWFVNQHEFLLAGIRIPVSQDKWA
ncbi:MAG: hypothetical protein J5950_01175 [Clostridia bacterium]|nr:hypothetical protein [Clostridia bacterium]